jgi:hypothetical protein
MFVPSGYVLIREALDRVGRELFPSQWTGEEHKARSSLISEDEWLRIKDLPPARGGGAWGSELTQRTTSPPPNHATLSRDPSDPAYQEEYRARNRYVEARDRLWQKLEAGELEGVILDVFTGNLHPVSRSLWRRHDADRVIKKGQAPVPRSPNTGRLLVKQFGDSSVPAKPIPQARLPDVIQALKKETATESLTRAQQKDFVRKTFPGFHITERQFTEIFQQVEVPPGRPRKSNKKV